MALQLCKSFHLCAALADMKYKQVGAAIALSLVHGGPAPRFWSTTLFDIMVLVQSYINRDSLTLTDVSDMGVKSVLEKVTIMLVR